MPYSGTPEEKKAKGLAYREKHREEAAARSRQWYADHKDDPEVKEARKQRAAVWRNEHGRDTHLAARKRRYQGYRENPEYMEDARMRVQRQRESKLPVLLAIIREAKSVGCVACREMDEVCLDFHHLDPATKSFTIGKEIQRLKPPEVLIAEIKKCFVVCANCHRRVHVAKMALPDTPLDVYWANRLEFSV